MSIYYRITAKKLCFSYEQFVNYRAAGPNAPAAPFLFAFGNDAKEAGGSDVIAER